MPIVVGYPRSGTTLLRLMIDAHPLVALPPETGFVAALALRPEVSVAAAVQLVCHHPADAPAWPDFQLDRDTFVHACSTCATPADVVRTFYRLYAARHGKSRWGDKTPLYLRHLQAIARFLPEARFIHLIRDGRDAVRSLRGRWFAPSDDLRSLAGNWREALLDGRRQGALVPHYLEVRYEALVADPEPELRRICAFLELDYAPAMSRPHERAPMRLAEFADRIRCDGSLVISRGERLVAQHMTTQPPDPSRSGGWRSAWTPAEHEAFLSGAGDLLAELGYL